MTAYFAYTRVSTAKQGEGVSLQEQREAIGRYAQRFGLEIKKWFEEKETAAKRGRPVFGAMLKLLKRNHARGVVMHKIDRSARNLKDWADLGELVDAGMEVHFANESLDLNTRGGRLSADIQAVVAADYIRNLREEARKGFYGRLKQGVYPLPAPLGYVDMGKGKPKEPNPVTAPLVLRAFQLYGTGKYGLKELVAEMYRLGLRNRRGGKVTLSGMSILLNNPFYIGLIRLRMTRETFEGGHHPLVPKLLFDRVQSLLKGKTVSREQRHEFLFRRLLTCSHCRYSLIGELQKGRTYYRCHTKGCATKSVREDMAEEAFQAEFGRITFSDQEVEYLRQTMAALQAQAKDQLEKERQNCELQLKGIRSRLERLTDAYLDGVVDRQLFEERKRGLLEEQRETGERLSLLARGSTDLLKRLGEFLELAKSARASYEQALPEEKRELVKVLTSNRWVDRKKIVVELSIPFQMIADRPNNTNCPPYRDEPRTWDKVLAALLDYFAKNPELETPLQK